MASQGATIHQSQGKQRKEFNFELEEDSMDENIFNDKNRIKKQFFNKSKLSDRKDLGKVS